MDQPPGSTEEPGVWQRFWDWFEEGTTTVKILTAVVAVVVVLGVTFALINGVVGQPSTGTSRSEQLDSYLSEYGGDPFREIRRLEAAKRDKALEQLAG